ncbi:MAG: AAA family ATPase, partial [Candidatus Methanomethylophilaceae archaeon]
MAEGHVRDKLTYPLPAVVGNDLAKKAIVVSLSSPDIHSLLICGPKGTGKSVLARSSESVSGGRRVLNLPSGSTEDRVFGGMDFERTVRDGRRACTGNLLSEADGNILLADNVNLLPEHIVHQVLNAAENGGFTIEREGISTSFDTSFLFIATMDPEEGMMSEHLLDRFDLCVFTATSDDEDERAEIADRNMRFLRDPEGFIEGCSGETGSITENIQRAYARARFTRIPDGYCGAISEVCNQLNVSGHRGDIAVMNASCAIAALDDRDIATLDDLKQAAAMCLEHRRNDDRQQQAPQEEPPEEDDEPDDDGEDQQQDQDEPEEDPNSDGTPDDHDNTREDDNDGPSDPDMPDLPPPGSEDMSEQVFEIGESFRVRDYMPGGGETLDKGMGGRRRGSKVQDRNGRCIGYAIPKGKVTDIA